MSSKVLLLDEVAALLRCHRTTLYRLLKQPGGIPGAFRVGGEWRFNAEQLEGFMAVPKAKRGAKISDKERE